MKYLQKPSRYIVMGIAIALITISSNGCSSPQNEATNPTLPTADSENSTHSVRETVLTNVDKDIDYMTQLGLMKGHMLVAKELLDSKETEQALPHLGHPVEEIYVDLEEQFKERNVPDFKQELIELQNLVRLKPNDPQIPAKFETAMEAIDTAINVIPESQRLSPEFVIPVINRMLEVASAEYTAAIADGKIKELIEYQDSRGFVMYSYKNLFQGVKPAIEEKNPTVAKVLNDSFLELQKAWPAAMPPVVPVMPPNDIARKVKEIQVISQNLLTESVKRN